MPSAPRGSGAPAIAVACSAALWLLLAGSVVFYPFDAYWAGSWLSRPGPFLFAFLAAGAAPAILVAMALARREAGARPAGGPPHPSRNRWLIPSTIALLCLLLPAAEHGAPLADVIPPYAAHPRINDSAPGAELLALGALEAGGQFGTAHGGLRAVLAAMALIWSVGTVFLVERLFSWRSTRTALSWGISLGLPFAQFAGYSEPSGFVAAFMPGVLALCVAGRPVCPLRRVVLFGAVAGALGAFHGISLILLPVLALAAAFGPFTECGGPLPRLDASRAARLAAATAIALAIMLAGSWSLREAWNGDAAFLPRDSGRVGLSPFVPMTSLALDEDSSAFYLFGDRYWLWERLQFLALPGCGLFILMAAAACSLRHDPEAPVFALGIATSGAVFALWNYDYGMYRDWNLLAVPATVAMLCALIAARRMISRWPRMAIVGIATMAAAPGVLLAVHNALLGARHGVPDFPRWSARVTGGRAALAQGTASGQWTWIDLPGEVTLDGPGELTLQLGKWGRTLAPVHSARWVRIGPREAEHGPPLAAVRLPQFDLGLIEDMGAGDLTDGAWSVATSTVPGIGDYLFAHRAESVPPLRFEFRVPAAGTYRAQVRAIGWTPDKPLQFAPILVAELSAAPAE